MHRRVITVALVIITTIALPSTSVTTLAACGGDVLGYFPSWARYLPVTPDDVDWSRLTIVSHAFLEVLDDATLREDADYTFTKPLLLAAAQSSGVKVLASIGGAAGCSNARLQSIAADPTLRQTLAANLVAYCAAEGYDGIGLDWEFPGVLFGPEPGCSFLGKDAGRCPVDRDNFVLLAREIRSAFDASPDPLLLSAAIPSTGWFGECYDGPAIRDLFDHLEVMYYDQHGAWSSHMGHNAPLIAPTADPDASAVSSMAYWTGTQGIPPAKLLMGLAFYGYDYPQACGLFDADVTGVTQRSYQEIQSSYLSNGWTASVDSEARVPYLLRDVGCGVVSFDDAASIAEKVDWARAQGFGGVMIWELSQDVDLVTGEEPLLDATAAAVGNRPPPVQHLLAVDRPGGVVELYWDEPTAGLGYDLVAADLTELAAPSPTSRCVIRDTPAATAVDSVATGPGSSGRFYLVRSRNSCATGSYESTPFDGASDCD